MWRVAGATQTVASFVSQPHLCASRREAANTSSPAPGVEGLATCCGMAVTPQAQRLKGTHMHHLRAPGVRMLGPGCPNHLLQVPRRLQFGRGPSLRPHGRRPGKDPPPSPSACCRVWCLVCRTQGCRPFAAGGQRGPRKPCFSSSSRLSRGSRVTASKEETPRLRQGGTKIVCGVITGSHTYSYVTPHRCHSHRLIIVRSNRH